MPSTAEVERRLSCRQQQPQDWRGWPSGKRRSLGATRSRAKKKEPKDFNEKLSLCCGGQPAERACSDEEATCAACGVDAAVGLAMQPVTMPMDRHEPKKRPAGIAEEETVPEAASTAVPHDGEQLWEMLREDLRSENATAAMMALKMACLQRRPRILSTSMGSRLVMIAEDRFLEERCLSIERREERRPDATSLQERCRLVRGAWENRAAAAAEEKPSAEAEQRWPLRRCFRWLRCPCTRRRRRRLLGDEDLEAFL